MHKFLMFFNVADYFIDLCVICSGKFQYILICSFIFLIRYLAWYPGGNWSRGCHNKCLRHCHHFGLHPSLRLCFQIWALCGQGLPAWEVRFQNSWKQQLQGQTHQWHVHCKAEQIYLVSTSVGDGWLPRWFSFTFYIISAFLGNYFENQKLTDFL